ncbi:RAM signaling pathway protein-domain-containing protein [Pyronema omphalodes]|nr:RAM signaling pathway protein-domain-containing protein [Pyronema omphalodes]
MPDHRQHLSVSDAQTNGPLAPIDDATCTGLIVNALDEARELARKKTQELLHKGATLPDELLQQQPGVTLDLGHKRIGNFPVEVIELMRDVVERISLTHNQLVSFPNEFGALPRLRYLNLRSNHLKEFPLALTRLPSLEVLELSRNRLRTLPPDLGNLINLVVLVLSKNKINALPTYIADMNQLKILKLDHNPLTFPPKTVWDKPESANSTNEDTRSAWLDGVKKFLRQHTERPASTTQESELGSSSDDGGGDNSFNPSFSRTPSFESSSLESETTLVNDTTEPPTLLRTVRQIRANGATAAGDAFRAKSPVPPSTPGHKKKHPSSSSINQATSTSMNGSPQRSELSSPGVTSPQTERLRSNSESLLGNREKRRGMPPPPRNNATPSRKPMFIPQSLRPVDEKPYKHTRGYSHDSVIDGGQNNAHAPSRSPTDNERRPGQYFRRLSSLPENKRSSLSSGRVGEAARGILYSLSTLQKPIEQFIASAGDLGGPESKVGRALYNSNLHVTSLVGALEAYEAKDDEPAVQKVIDACQTCVAAFRQVLSMLQSSLKEMEPGSIRPDVRYARTLMLMLYGSYVEIQCSYENLRPLLLAHTVADSRPMSRSGPPPLVRHQTAPNILQMRYNNNNNSTNSSTTDHVSSTTLQAPLATPRNLDATFGGLQTPWTRQPSDSQRSDSGFDQEGALYQKFQAATNAAINMLPQIDKEAKSASIQSIQPAIAIKLRDVSLLCGSGCEAARGLTKIRWDAMQAGDLNERKKFWDETNKFTQVGFFIFFYSVYSKNTFLVI